MESLGDCVQAALAKNGTGEHTTTNGVEFLIDRLSNDIKKTSAIGQQNDTQLQYLRI